MKSIRKIATGCLLSVGFICLLGTVFNVIQPKQTQENRDKALAGLVLGLPLTISGVWLIRNLAKQHQQRKENYLYSKFFHLIEKGQGSITVLNFAMEAQISSEESTKYLEEYSKKFNADFEVTARGNVVYKFDVLSRNNNLQSLPLKQDFQA